jgi:hypothetical protein
MSNYKKLLIIITVLIIVTFSFYWGMQTSKRKVFPYEIINFISRYNPDLRVKLNDVNCKKKNGIIYFNGYYIKKINENTPFPVRDGAGAVVLNENLFLIGGWNPNDRINFPRVTSNEVWKSSDYGITWHLIKPNTYDEKFNYKEDWRGRHNSGFIVKDGYIYILNGDIDYDGKYISDIWKSNDGVNWLLVTNKLPFGNRILSSSFVYNNYIYVMGGQTLPFKTKELVDEIYYRDMWRSKDGIKWEKVEIENNGFQPRGGYGGSGFVLNNEVYIIGGFEIDANMQKYRSIWNDMWKSSGNLNKWHNRGSSPVDNNGNGFMYHETAVYDNKIWTIGGMRKDLRNTNEIWYKNEDETWSKFPCSPFPPTHSTSVWSTKNGIVIGAGNGWSKKIYLITKE